MPHYAISDSPAYRRWLEAREIENTSRALPFAFAFYVFLSCLYVFPSGNPQPSDFLLVAVMAPTLLKLFLQKTLYVNMSYAAGILFVGLTMVINPIHYFFMPDKKFLLSGLYYVYNFLVYFFVSHLFRTCGDEVRKQTYWAVVAVIIFQLLFILFFPDFKIRQTGTLNNPNQLSYWSLLTLMMLIILKGNEKLKIHDFVLIGVLLYFQTVALSKAGLISSFLVLLVLPLMPQFSNLGRFMSLGAALFIMCYLVIHPGLIEQIPAHFENIDRTVSRLEDIGQDTDDSFQGRGYYRLLEFPEYVLLGAGEGAEERFDPGRPIELHSGVATIIFSYGIFGALCFSFFLYSAVRNRPWYFMAFVFFVILYGLTHQNFRFTHFWMLLGMMNGIQLRNLPRSILPLKNRISHASLQHSYR